MLEQINMRHSKDKKPPQWLLHFFRWYCHPDYQEDIEGDLWERFERRTAEKGIRAAQWGFFKDVIRLFRPGIIRSWEGSYQLNYYGMYKNYFKVTWRNLLKHKLYAFINIGGLALGLACFIAIFLYISHEYSYDRHFEHADHIYRVYVHEHSGEKYLSSALYATIPLPLAEAMRDEFPEILHLTSIEEHPVLLGKERDHYMENGLWVDDHFFDVF